MKRMLLLLLAAAVAMSATPAGAESPGRLKTLGLSLLLPGLGHKALGHNNRARGFMAAELGIWTGFTVAQVQGKLRKDSYIEMAELFGHVPEADGRSDDYYRRIGRYRNSEIYDDEIRRDARARFGDDLEAREEYYRRNRVPDDQVWNWVSYEEWRRYRDKRSESQGAYKRADFMLGIAVANRLLAAVDGLRLVHAKAKQDGLTTLHFSLRPDFEEPSEPTRFCVTVRFP